MSVAALSLAALLIAVLVSCVSEINVGVLAIVFAWIVGVYFGDMTLAQLTAGFPSQIFLTLAGVTPFACAADAAASFRSCSSQRR